MRTLTHLILLTPLTVLLTGCPRSAAEPSAAPPLQPSTAQPVVEQLFGSSLVKADGQAVPVSGLEHKKIGVYFSAHWCPPCRAFTPKLVKAYNGIRKDHEDFEIVFVSSDRSHKEMFEYMKKMNMPWLAVPFESRKIAELADRFHVRGIPTFVVIDSTGKLLSGDARRDIAVSGADAYKSW